MNYQTVIPIPFSGQFPHLETHLRQSTQPPPPPPPEKPIRRRMRSVVESDDEEKARSIKQVRFCPICKKSRIGHSRTRCVIPPLTLTRNNPENSEEEKIKSNPLLKDIEMTTKPIKKRKRKRKYVISDNKPNKRQKTINSMDVFNSDEMLKLRKENEKLKLENTKFKRDILSFESKKVDLLNNRNILLNSFKKAKIALTLFKFLSENCIVCVDYVREEEFLNMVNFLKFKATLIKYKEKQNDKTYNFYRIFPLVIIN